jgi:hypothetical protein
MRSSALNTWPKARSQILVLPLLFGDAFLSPATRLSPTNIFAFVSAPARSIYRSSDFSVCTRSDSLERLGRLSLPVDSAAKLTKRKDSTQDCPNTDALSASRQS